MKHEELVKVFEELNKYDNEEEFINEFITLLQQIFYSRTSFVKNSDNVEKRNEFFIELKRKFIETYNSYKSRNEDNSKISDIIKYIGCGHSSLAFKIGDLVIKVSKQKYDSNPLKLKDVTGFIPVFYYSDSEIDSHEHYSILITPYVEICTDLGEELYEVYKSKRIQGYVWNDPTSENVGVITKDFVFNNQVYKKGDKVVVDLEDFTFVGEVTPDYVWDFITYEAYNSKTYTYEERYTKELEQKKK
jgi:hypothetical protein